MCNENNSGCAGGQCGEKGNCGGCSCGMGKCKGCLGGHKVIRFAVGFFLLWLVFAFGMQIGELKSEVSGNYKGSKMMRGYGNQNYRMMDNTWAKQVSTPAVESTAPAVKK